MPRCLCTVVYRKRRFSCHRATGSSKRRLGSASAAFSFSVGAVSGRSFVRPEKPLADCCSVAHQRSDRRVILLAVFEPAYDRAIKARAFGDIANTQAAPFAISFQGLQGMLD